MEKENNILTAEEVLISTTPSMISCGSCLEAMKQYAWLHVQAALQAASEQAEMNYFPSAGVLLDSKSILTSYPKENIK